jgi:hypothetical protein
VFLLECLFLFRINLPNPDIDAMKPLFLLTILLFSTNGLVVGQNILISNRFEPNEPSIIMNPKHPNRLVAGSNLNNFYVSNDTGRTWTENRLFSNFGVWGDPAIAVDTADNFYFFHLSNPFNGHWIDRIVCQKSTNNGASWSDGSAVGLNGSKMQDKQWCVVDRTNNILYLTWTQFDDYGSTLSTDSSIILFARSEDLGETWSTPKRINKIAGDCIDDDNTVEGAVPAIGPNGEIYVAWAGPNGIVFNQSLDRGNTWIEEEIIVDNMPGGWNYKIPGINRANGLPITKCDLSNGPNRGTIYINWSDQRNGLSNTDVWLAKSTDGGKTWTSATKVNNDASNRHQFSTWMDIDQTNGFLYFIFYDRRNHTTDSTDVYLALSKDGGQSFINHKISQSPFLPDSTIFFGDYTNITVHQNIVRPIWTRLNNGQLSIWTDISTPQTFLSLAENTKIQHLYDFEHYPNPSQNTFFVSFKLHETSKVNLAIYNLKGEKIASVIDSENRSYGKYVERVNSDSYTIPSGTYMLNLEINGKIKTSRHIIIK